MENENERRLEAWRKHNEKKFKLSPVGTYLFNEKTGTASPTQFRARIYASQSRRTFTQLFSLTTDIIDFQRSTLGTTNPAISNNGRMSRTPPLADPLCPTLFAESIERMQGMGQSYSDGDGNGTSALPFLDAPTLPTTAFYPSGMFGGNSYASYYECDINFTQRGYNCFTDEKISQTLGQFWPDPILDSNSNRAWSYKFWNEWSRFTEGTCTPAGEWLTCQGGMLQYSSTQIQAANPGLQPPGLDDAIKMYIPNYKIILKWFHVPVRYISSDQSYIRKGAFGQTWKGRINQNAMTLPIDGENWNFAPGQLRYDDYSYVSYTPPSRLANRINGGVAKLCDITLVFTATDRIMPVGDSVLSGTVPNASYVPGGHNLLPRRADKAWHYAVGNINTSGYSGNVPLYSSAPLEMLQNDPDTLNMYY